MGRRSQLNPPKLRGSRALALDRSIEQLSKLLQLLCVQVGYGGDPQSGARPIRETIPIARFRACLVRVLRPDKDVDDVAVPAINQSRNHAFADIVEAPADQRKTSRREVNDG